MCFSAGAHGGQGSQGWSLLLQLGFPLVPEGSVVWGQLIPAAGEVDLD